MSRPEPARAPRLGQWFVARLVRADERAMVLGDLEEEFAATAAGAGRARATVKYWRAALALAWGLWAWAPRPPGPPGIFAFSDLRYAARRLRRQPLATSVSVLTLGGAIGAAAATWSLISAVLINPLDVSQPERLVQIAQRTLEGRRAGAITTSYAYPTYATLRDVAPLPLAAWGSIGSATPLTVEITGEPIRRTVRFAAHNLLQVLGLRPSVGRFFSEDDDRRGAPLVAVLSDRFWRGEFGADPAVVGRVIRVRDHQVEIVGVGPPGFRGLEVRGAPDLFLPLHAIDQIEPYVDAAGRDLMFGPRPPVYWVELVGRLPDGVTVEQMTASLNGIDLVRDASAAFVLRDVFTAALTDDERTNVTHFTSLLAITVALLLGIGSLTVGMLLVLRTDARRHELALCVALGARRLRLAVGVFAEAVLLAAAGVVLALPVSQLLIAGIRQFQLPGGIRIAILDLPIDFRVIGVAGAAAAACVCIIAAVAAVFALRPRADDVLRSQIGATPRVHRRWSRSALVTAQVAVTLVLVTGAGLFARSVARALSLNPGIDTSRLVTAALNPAGYGYDVARETAFYRELLAGLAGQPAIAAATLEWNPGGVSAIDFDGQKIKLSYFMSTIWIDPDYFATLGLGVSAGRALTGGDRGGAPDVGVVTASLAAELGGSAAILNRRIDGVTVVGVVPDFVWSIGVRPLRLYRPSAQEPPFARYPGSGGRTLVVRASGDVALAMRAITQVVRQLDPKMQVARMASVERTVLDAMAPQRFGMTVMGALGAIALLLSVLGTWVLAETMATARRREIGIRTALGARGGQLRNLLLAETVRLVGLGLLLGFGLAWLGAGTIRAFLFQVEPFDPLVTGSVAGVIVALAVLASLRPALTATRLDVARVLREQ
jgi:predicted permease